MSRSIFQRDDIKRAEIIEICDIEQSIIQNILIFLHRTGSVQFDTLSTLMKEYNCRIEKRRAELFERTKDEILPKER